ncbi:hypothetical protein TcCL_Unassigned00329, partial [Trypanosoma cruzi]
MGETQPCTAPLHFPTTQFLRARTKQQTQSECTQTQSSPSLAKPNYSHGVTTFGDTPAVAGCMEFPCQPCEETQQLCGVKLTAPRCCPQSTWKEEFHARIVPNPSLPECTSTEQVKKIRACKMAFKYGKSSACFVRWCWRAVPHNPIKVTRRTVWRQPIINKNNCANAKAAKIGFAPHSGGDSGMRVCMCAGPFVGWCCPTPAVAPTTKRATEKRG